MNKLKKLFVPSGQKQELTAYESWSVRWRSRHGQYSTDTRDQMEIFTTKKDAMKFVTELKEAFKLIKHTSGTDIIISKN